MGNNCCCCTRARHLVSRKKKRTVLDSDESPVAGGVAVDLDLWAVHPRIVAMGFPATGTEALYRNPLDDVKAYLDAQYPEGRYWVYNLCSEPEHQYHADRFDGRVTSFPFPDHHPCPLRMCLEFTAHAGAFLQRDERNVVVVHCKAGKGRTGLMVCCLLLELVESLQLDADRAMALYGSERTHNGKGLTIPSQRRYVAYYARARRCLQIGSSAQLGALERSATITGVRLYDLASVGVTSVRLGRLRDARDKESNVDHGVSAAVVVSGDTVGSEEARWAPLCVQGDMRLELLAGSAKPVGAITFNTAFLEDGDRVFAASDVDALCKRKGLGANARIELLESKS